VDNTTLLIILILVLLLFGGGWYGRGRWTTSIFEGAGFGRRPFSMLGTRRPLSRALRSLTEPQFRAHELAEGASSFRLRSIG
jgi:hypothetical protein